MSRHRFIRKQYLARLFWCYSEVHLQNLKNKLHQVGNSQPIKRLQDAKKAVKVVVSQKTKHFAARHCDGASYEEVSTNCHRFTKEQAPHLQIDDLPPGNKIARRLQLGARGYDRDQGAEAPCAAKTRR